MYLCHDFRELVTFKSSNLVSWLAAIDTAPVISASFLAYLSTCLRVYVSTCLLSTFVYLLLVYIVSAITALRDAVSASS